MTKVAVTDAVATAVRERARELGLALETVVVRREPPQLPESSGAEVALGTPGLRGATLQRFLRANPTVRWVHASLAGVDSLLVPEVTETAIVLTRPRGLHHVPVAEFAMGLILYAAKGFRGLLEAQQQREWRDTQARRLEGSRLVIVGYGEIGRALAHRARPFGMRITGVRRHPRPDDLAERVVDVNQLHEALGEADYVVLLAPSTRETAHLIGRAELAAMPRHGYLINVARGELVDEQALLHALDEDVIAGALLDVFAAEPLPTDHPFWSHPKVLVTPHAAGLRGPGVSRPMVDQFLDSLRRYQNGEPLLNQVDKQLGY